MFTASLPPSIVASVRQALRVVQGAAASCASSSGTMSPRSMTAWPAQGFKLGPRARPGGRRASARPHDWRSASGAPCSMPASTSTSPCRRPRPTACRCCAARSARSHTKEQLEHMIEVMTGIGRQMGVLAPKLRGWLSQRRPGERRPRLDRRRRWITPMFTLAHLSDPHLPMPHGAAAAAPEQARHRLLQLVAPPRASPCARGAGRHRGRHQGAEARPHRADRRSRERLPAAGIPPRRRVARGASARPTRITVIPGNHDVYVPMPWDRGPRPVGRLHGGRRPAAGQRASTSSRPCAGATASR